jgi:thymidylate synthase
MKQYLDMLQDILDSGEERQDRTGTGTLSIFGHQTKYDLQKGFPAVTTKKLWFKGVVHELLWMLSGATDIHYLVKNGVNIWNDDCYRYYLNKKEKEKRRWQSHYEIKILTKEEFVERAKNNKLASDLGNVYGMQWRRWNNGDPDIDGKMTQTDQLYKLLRGLKENPYSRRHIISAWNPADLENSALPPCHAMFQFYVSNDKKLSCQMYQRSGDAFLGVPYNIASYALLTHMIAKECGFDVGNFIHTLGDVHIYKNHVNQVRRQLQNKPLNLPELWLNPEIGKVLDFKYEDIKLLNYKSHDKIKAPLSVGL